MKRRIRVAVGNASVLPIIGLMLANRVTWAATSWIQDRARNMGWTHFDADQALIATCKRLENWTYAEKEVSDAP